MILNKISKSRTARVADRLSVRLKKDPMFMFLCKDYSKRSTFIYDYLKYYIPEWTEYDTLLCDESCDVLVSLVDPKTFEYHFKGQGAFKMRAHRDSSMIFVHRENLEGIIEILVPETRDSRVMNIYTVPEENIESIAGLVREAKELAIKENYVLLYETFSRVLIPYMENQGFKVVYSKQFLNTQFIETVMIFNLEHEAPQPEETK